MEIEKSIVCCVDYSCVVVVRVIWFVLIQEGQSWVFMLLLIGLLNRILLSSSTTCPVLAAG